ncbi:uncharacterized protein LOC135690583 [Rhopilema esculentum]|uniref:uncharacterized protein LOC135690583 n=1 Tax=Rhopilema esculentum TaxID=499914 RepID=UPI0031D530FB|eukprot:gene1052-15382_t
MASIEGKCLVLVNVNLRRFQRCVSIHYHITNARAIVGKASLRGSGNMEIEDSYTGMISTPVRSVSVIYISTRLIISATWMRQIPNLIQKEGSIGNKTNGMVMKKRHSEDGSIHEGLFQFDKAFAQEIKYLFAELDFDLYMCREKQDAMKQQYAKYQKDLTWKFKEQNETLVYFVRGNEAVRVSNEMGMNEAKQIPMDYSDNNRSNHQIDVAVEDYLEQCLNERTVDVTIEDYLRQCIKERRTDVTVEDYLDKCLKKLATDVTVEAYLQQCLNERAKDVTVEDYLNQYRHERIEDVTVEACLQQCLNERARDVTIEDYLNQYRHERIEDVTVEAYLQQCLNERAKDVTVEDYLNQCLHERIEDVTVKAYLQQCLNERARDVTIEHYLNQCLNERAKDVTVEAYLQQCLNERAKDVTVEDYLNQCLNGRAQDVTVEDYLNQCLNERAKDVTVEDYLNQCLNERAQDVTVEDYLNQCLNERAQDVTVEDYLNQCLNERAQDVTVEDYLNQCLNERAQDVTVEDYLNQCLNERAQDVTVEDYLNQCLNERAKDVTIEDYLNQCLNERAKDVTVEAYLDQCLNERAKDVTIEDYLDQCLNERAKDVTVEDYLNQCLNERAKDVTVEAYLDQCLNERAKDVTIEDYLDQCLNERAKDVTIEDYLDQCLNERAKDVTIEDYLDQCLNERAKDVTIEDYLDQCLNERDSEILTEAEEDVWSMFRYDLAEGSSRLLSYDTADDEKLSKNRNNTDYLMTDANNNVNKEAGEGIRTQGSRLKNLCAEEMQLDLAENQPETKNESTRKASPLIVEENLFEQYQSVDESIYEVDFSGYHDDLTGSKYSIVEEDIAACSFAEKEMLSMEEALERQGMIYSAELWLIFVPYRRSPWTQVSVSYYDNFTFDWSISRIEEASALETAAESVGNGNDENNTFLSGGFCTRVEEDVIAQNQVAVVLEEIQFSSLDDVDCSKQNDVTEKENNVTALGESKPDGVNGLGDPRNTKYDIAIVKIDHNHTEKKREATGKEFSSLSSLSKKGFMYKSREKVFVGHEAESSSGWNSLEKIQYKQTKLISVPETLRRTVSSELIKVNTSGADKDVEEKETSSKEVYSGSLLISPFQGFGKNLKESNV